MTASRPVENPEPTPETLTAEQWEAIAWELYDRVLLAINHLKATGIGEVRNSDTGERQPWREYMAEGLEMIPGIKVDREVLQALDLPAKHRRKRLLEIREAKAKMEGGVA